MNDKKIMILRAPQMLNSTLWKKTVSYKIIGETGNLIIYKKVYAIYKQEIWIVDKKNKSKCPTNRFTQRSCGCSRLSRIREVSKQEER